jgi:hypothetical protein
MALPSAWVRRQARYRIVGIVRSAIEGADLLAESHGYTDEEFREICDEIGRILNRQEEYADQLEEPSDA